MRLAFLDSLVAPNCTRKYYG